MTAMTVITRFAPSPTGRLHIGGARTALFNWLFARHHGGKFLLRIEDTDRARSTEENVSALIQGLEWLGLDWDEEPISQFERKDRHTEVAEQLVKDGKAYYCYCSPEELQEMRETAREEGRNASYDGRWRDRDVAEAPEGIAPVIRLKTAHEGLAVIQDHVQGDVTVKNDQIDDFIILRSDKTPTYMLSVVVDDHDMGVTHIIRGDDHLTNAFRQKALYDALGWDTPEFSHIPLIHGPDGKKLSKRHGALGVDAYAEMGYLPEAMCNYLSRLGWSHGDDELFTMSQAIEWFTLEGLNKAPSRLDFDKMNFVNSHYLKQTSDEALANLIKPLMDISVSHDAFERMVKAMPELKERGNTLNDIASDAKFLITAPTVFDEKAQQNLDDDAKVRLKVLADKFEALENFSNDTIFPACKEAAKESGVKMGQIGMPLRAALTGGTNSPSIFHMAEILGKEEVLKRLRAVL